MTSHNVITFYQYKNVPKPDKFVHVIKAICNRLNILGRILVGFEGINGGACGTKEDIENFKKEISGRFPGITYREIDADHQVYHKLVVKHRPEIVRLGEDVDLNNQGEVLSPEEFTKLAQDPNTVLIDTRNDYEYDVGHFKNAVRINAHQFLKFPEEVDKLDLEGKNVVMYCTGGIRCHKASAYLKKKGHDNVYQLQGGIINYVQKEGNDLWEGGLFVFDDRLVWPISEPIAECKHCGNKTDKYIDCHNVECDKLFICCEECQQKMNMTCSEECLNAPRHRSDLKNEKKVEELKA
jgi:UPF0176 protein